MDIKKEFSARLQYVMDLNNKKQTDVSKDLHIPKSGICQYLKGKGNPTTDRVIRLATYFKVNPEWLMGQDVSMELEKDNHIDNKDLEITFDDFTYAMYNETKDLTEEQKAAILNMAKAFKSSNK